MTIRRVNIASIAVGCSRHPSQIGLNFPLNGRTDMLRWTAESAGREHNLSRTSVRPAGHEGRLDPKLGLH